jgi:anti-anti-sigma factor
MATETFGVTVADAGDVFLISCDGELDLTSSDRLRASADWVVALHPQSIHLDCNEVTFIDSVGINAMMVLASTCHQKGIELTLSMNTSLQRLFDKIGVSALFSPAR